MLFNFKAYESEKCFGGLLALAAPYLQYIKNLEDLFVKDFTMFTKHNAIGETILSKLQDVPVPFTHCTEFPLQYLLKLFLRMRIYYTIKFANREFSARKRNKEKSKLKLPTCRAERIVIDRVYEKHGGENKSRRIKPQH